MPPPPWYWFLVLFSLGYSQIVKAPKLLLQEKSPNVLHPDYVNLSSGKKITATATCGERNGVPESQIFCKLTGGGNMWFTAGKEKKEILQGQHCDVCDASDPLKDHSAAYAIDGTEKWWQSPPLSQGLHYNEINITIDLGQVFHVAYVIVKFANSPRAGTWVLERSRDYGLSWEPWQYFADTDSNCMSDFGKDPFAPIIYDNQVICTSKNSDVVPLENGEVIVSLINGREGAQNYSHAPLLQDFTKATNVRLRLLRTKTLLGHLMAVQRQDSTVTRRYFYSIKDISIGGRCECNGHSNRCIPSDAHNGRLVCKCRHNTCGESCDQCCAGYEQKKWQPALPSNPNICEPCNCHGHSDQCIYDEEVAKRRLSMDIHGEYNGGGICQSCRHNTAGINCEACKEGYYRPMGASLDDPEGCKPCGCASEYTIGSCEPVTGRCYCKPEYSGDKCDRCAEGYYDFPACKKCDCFFNGTSDGNCFPESIGGSSNTIDDSTSYKPGGIEEFDETNPGTSYQNGAFDVDGDDMNDGGVNTIQKHKTASFKSCKCRSNFAGRLCDVCADGYYNFPTCEPCHCSGEGVEDSETCDIVTGSCNCRLGYTGDNCDQCEIGYYNYPLCSPCPCSTVGSTDQVCDAVTGECICDDTYDGERCDRCQPGHWGFPNCGRCDCTGHGAIDDICDPNTGQCNCHEGYGSQGCDQCSQNYYSYPACEPCGCNMQGSLSSTCNQQSGQCSCRGNIEGRKCDRCSESFFNYPTCEACSCDSRGIVYRDPSTCPAFSMGQCPCKNNVDGKNCDTCMPKYWNMNEDNPEGCEDCNCYKFGTLNGLTDCVQDEGMCACREFSDGNRQCSSCREGFYALNDKNYFGCDGCQCDVGGAFETICDQYNGQCSCRANVVGRSCDDVEYGYCYPTLYQYVAEFENGITVSGLKQIRYGFNQTRFPNYSFRGYAEMSSVQKVLIVAIEIPKSRLYRALINYVNENDQSIDAIMSTVSLIDYSNTTNMAQDFENGSYDDSIQQFQVLNFRPTKKGPATLICNIPLVLDEGLWSISIEADSGLLLDNIILLPNEYYEPGILQKSVTEACNTDVIGEKCIKYDYLDYPVSSVRHEFEQIIEEDAEHDASVEDQELNWSVHDYAVLKDEDTIHSTINLYESGRYVFVLSYKTLRSDDKKQAVNLYIETSADDSYYATFNIFSCNYNFECRQVALNDDNLAFVVEINDMNVDVQLTATGWLGDSGPRVYIKDIIAIPEADWNREYITPSKQCVSEGKISPYDAKTINFDCEESRWSVPPTSIEILPKEKDTTPYTPPDTTITHQVVVLENDDQNALFFGPLTRTQENPESRFVIVVHYFQPDHLEFTGFVDVDSYPGRVKFAYCPAVSGCRSVVICSGTPDLKLLSDSVSVNIRIPDNKFLLIKSVIVIPVNKWDQRSCLNEDLVDLSEKFIKECGSNGFRNLPGEIEYGSFCHKAVKSLSLFNNDGAFACNCAAAGTINGDRDSCEAFGCQCPCKENVIGLACTECATGFWNYPDCEPCNCGNGICDPHSGECICPPNTNEYCTDCQLNFYQFHPILGCAACDCNEQGSESLACDVDDGQCQCAEFVTGRQCDRCEDGYWGFPHCRPCECNESGSTLTTCDSSGNCLCKANVKGRQCSYCQDSTFNLGEQNPLGCTECFCFGAFGLGEAPLCQSARYQVDAFYDDNGWTLQGIENENNVGEPDQMSTLWVYDILKTQDVDIPYWVAPNSYLGNKISAYGGKLTWSTRCSAVNSIPTTDPNNDCRGDQCGGGEEEESLTSTDCFCEDMFKYLPDLIISGAHMPGEIVYSAVEDPNHDIDEDFGVQLLERNFKWSDGRSLAREDFMMILVNVDSIRVKSTCSREFESLGLTSPLMEHVDFDAVSDFAGLPTVEVCRCPAGYIGSSCEACDKGYYREKTGRYLGKCLPCKCSGNCETCGDDGLPSTIDCQKHTTGTFCEDCEFGYIKKKEGGECEKCPCPIPSEDNSFASQCWHVPTVHDVDTEVNDLGRLDIVMDASTLPDSAVYCQCDSGYSGDQCETCDSGFWGNPVVHGSNCQECNCNGNSLTCDKDTGICDSCTGNTGGDHCEDCADGYYGDASEFCEICLCDNCGTHQCDKTDGYCSCKGNVGGEYCDRCEDGYWNFPQTCESDHGGCERCQCSDFALDNNCDKDSGQCSCPPNVVGKACDECAPDTWGLGQGGQGGCVECDCPGLPCNPHTGQCDCPIGITGRQCDRCEKARSVIRADSHTGELYCYECNECIDHLMGNLHDFEDEHEFAQRFEELNDMSQGTLAWRRLAVANNSFANTKALKNMIDARVDLVLGTGDEFKDSEKVELNLDGEISNTKQAATETEDYYSYDYFVYDEEIEVGQLLIRGRSIFLKSGRVCQTIEQIETDSHSSIDQSHKFDEETMQLYHSAWEFQGTAEDIANELEYKVRYFDNQRFQDMLLQGRHTLELIKTDTGPLNEILPAVNIVFDKAEEIAAAVRADFPTPDDSKIVEKVNGLESKIGYLRDILVTGQKIENTVNDIGNQQDGFIKLITDTQVQTSMTIIDTNNLLKDMVRVTNETANLLKSIIQHGTSLGNTGKDILAATEVLSDQKYNNYSWYEEVDSNLKIAAEYADMSVERVRPLNSPFDNVWPLYSNYIETIGNISEIDGSLAKASTESNHALAILDSRDILEEKALMEKERAKELLKLAKSSTVSSDMSPDDAHRIAKTIDDSISFNNKANAEIKDTDQKVAVLIKDVSEQEEDDKRSIVSKAERQAELTHKDVKVKFDQIHERFMASDQATNLLREAVETQKNFDMDLDQSSDILRDLKPDSDEIASMDTDLSAEVLRDLAAVEKLIDDFDLEKTMTDCSDLVTEIEKELDYASQTAKLFRYSMEFKGSDETGQADYVQPHIPVSVGDLRDRTKVSFAARLQSQNSVQGRVLPNDGLLFYLGGQEGNSDYMAVETIDGKVVFHFRISDGYGRIKTNETIFDSEDWRQITVSRFGNYGVLNVTTKHGYITQSAYTQGLRSNGYVASDFTNPVFYFGGLPPEQWLPSQIANTDFYGHIDSVELNGQNIALWFYKQRKSLVQQNSFDSTAPSSTRQHDNKCYFFDGESSFFQIPYNFFRTKNGGFGATFQFLTLQKNALIMLYGTTKERFVALEVRDGYTTFTYNLEFPDGPKTHVFNQVYLPETDLQNEYIICRVGVIGNVVGIALIDKKQRTHTFRLPSSNVKIESDLFFGGVYEGHIQDYINEFKPYVKNIDMRLRGRIYQPINVNIRDFDPGTPEFYQTIGMWPGCGRDQDLHVVDLSPAKKGAKPGKIVVKRSKLRTLMNLEGFVSFTTAEQYGDILTAVGDFGNQVRIHMKQGHVYIDDGKHELKSQRTYSDSRKHYLYFKRSDVQITLAIDDDDFRTRSGIQALTGVKNEGVEITVGGNFTGCVSAPYFIGKRSNPHGTILNVRCNKRTAGECFGRPDFNQCSVRPAQSILMRSVQKKKNSGGRKGGKHSGRKGWKGGRKGKNKGRKNKFNKKKKPFKKIRKNKNQNRKKFSRKFHNKHKKREHSPEWMDVQKDQPIPVQFFGGHVASGAGCSLQAPELEGHSFPGTGHILHRDVQFNTDDSMWRISVEVRSMTSKSILMVLRPDQAQGHEHTIVSLQKGRVVLTIVDANGVIRKLRQSSSSSRINDNAWHKIDAVRDHNHLQLLVDGIVEANGRAAEVYGSIIDRVISSEQNPKSHWMYSGGIPARTRQYLYNLLNDTDIDFSGYKGCIRGQRINGKMQFIENAVDTLLVEPCFNGEREVGLGFFAGGYAEHRPVIFEDEIYPLSGKHIEIKLRLRARTQDGIILAVRGEFSQDALALVLRGGRLEGWMWQRGKEYHTVFSPKDQSEVFCNGRWHDIVLLKTRNLLVLTVNDSPPAFVEGLIDVSPMMTSTPLYIGGLSETESKFNWPSVRSFVGCIGSITLNGSPITGSQISINGDVSLDFCPAN